MLNDSPRDDVDNVDPQQGSDAVNEAPEQKPVRRRRAASRPSGPPNPVKRAAPVVQPPVTEAATEPEIPAEPESPAEVVEPAAAVEPQAVVEPEAPESESPSEPPAVETDAAVEEPTAQTELADEPAAPAKRTRKATTRTRVVREAGAPRTRRRPAQDAEETPAPAAEAAPEAPAEDSTDDSTDELGARLRAAAAAAAGRAGETRTRGRRVSGVVANPFAPAGDGDTESVLQSLAASIAGTAPVAPAHRAPVAVEPTPEVIAQDAILEDEPTDESETPTEDEQPIIEAVEPTDTDDDESAEDSDTDDGDDDSEGPRRRRRRRGGRRRRRGSDTDDADDSEDSDTDESGSEDTAEADGSHKPDVATPGDPAADADEPELGDPGRRRRRRRRRRGEDAGGAEDDPTEVVVRVREPRAPRSVSDEVTGIEGSTRLEAKRQRRKEGRAAGRRRAPILSEAEFLARRESVKRSMLIRQREDYIQLAVLEDDILVEHYVDRASATSLIGNVYMGRIQNVLPSMEAAFIDIGRGRNAVLYAGEVDWDSFGAQGGQRKIEQVFKSGQTVLVQVSKDPVGAKGARLTSHVSLPGRYVVYSPGGQLSGISRKLADAERHRLKEILGNLIDESSSVIVRTAAEGASEDELVRDVTRLKAQWDAIEKKVKQGSAPQLLYSEPVPTVRIVRDLFTEDFAELVVQGAGGTEDVSDTIVNYVEHVAPHLLDRVQRWDNEQGDVFAKFRVDEQIVKALERKVFLPSGGSLVIDRTEAMTVIDVNTGRFTGTAGNLEATVTSNNLEAAEEVVRQLRLRDIGGIIVIDFIDMVLPNNRDLLIRRLTECLARDRTRHQVAEVSSLGLVQMTRKKIGTGLAEAFTEECECCGGRGYHKASEPVESQAQADGGDRGGRRNPSHPGHAPVPALATPAEEPAPRRRRSRRSSSKTEEAAPIEE